MSRSKRFVFVSVVGVALLLGSAESSAEAAPCGTLLPGGSRAAGQKITSCNGRYSLTMQTDGRLVLRDRSAIVWATKTCGAACKFTLPRLARRQFWKTGRRLTMKTNGDLSLSVDATMRDLNRKRNVVRANRAMSVSRTSGHAGARLVLENDGKLVVRARDGTELWRK